MILQVQKECSVVQHTKPILQTGLLTHIFTKEK